LEKNDLTDVRSLLGVDLRVNWETLNDTCLNETEDLKEYFEEIPRAG
jgi:hypothetical protein